MRNHFHSLTLLAIIIFGSTCIYAAGQRSLTESERRAVHSRAMNEGESGQIPRLLALRSDDIILPNPTGPTSPVVSDDDSAVVATLACFSERVVTATAGTPSSYMTENRGWIYTEWPFEVDEVIKAGPQDRLRRSSTVFVLQSGGEIQVGGRRVAAAAPPQSAQFIPGVKYLLFLIGRIPSTGAGLVLASVELGPRRPNEKEPQYPSLRRQSSQRLVGITRQGAAGTAPRVNCLK